ncbi:MAG: molybdopterin-guanine dinucleotide biosynthesis protein B [Burkholderiaceae bacterium]|jgi:molybdopterin-guanine dinucleotide biosynthesis protein B|nr:molybdopterin-guanine dinucleotide biosynthesis protein B [Burkholderiaceae bacterium]
MNVIGFTGFSGAGKTTLVEGLVRAMRAQGLRVSVIKHARNGFELDQPGKDSYRHREAGAFEVLVASNRRLALQREFEVEVELTVHQMLAEMYPGVDWVLVEGFNHSDLLKLEVWRHETGHPATYPDDDFVVGIVTNSPDQLPSATLRPVLDLNDPTTVAQWLIDHQDRFYYNRFDEA